MPSVEKLQDSPANRKISRRRLLKGGLLGAAALALYSGEVERHWVDLQRLDVRLRNLPAALEGLRIVQLSDIHLDSYTEAFFLRYVVDRINSLKPDLVLLTGDFVSAGLRNYGAGVKAAWECGEILNELQCSERYAVPGNHDLAVGAKYVTEALTARRIRMLTNAYVPIERTGGRLWLAGVDDPLAGHPDSGRAIPASIRNRPDEPVILMAHEPDYVDELLIRPEGKAIDLVVSGHTHGGQIRLPFFGPMILPDLGQKYVEGLFHLGQTQLYVSRGIGTVGVPFRLDCPPELTEFTLRRG
jgi:uncharacterized protein